MQTGASFLGFTSKNSSFPFRFLKGGPSKNTPKCCSYRPCRPCTVGSLKRGNELVHLPGDLGILAELHCGSCNEHQSLGSNSPFPLFQLAPSHYAPSMLNSKENEGMHSRSQLVKAWVSSCSPYHLVFAGPVVSLESRFLVWRQLWHTDSRASNRGLE